MQKIINKYTIFTFVLGILVCSISVYAFSTSSSDISYKSNNSEFTATNVETALNTLYDRSKNITDRIDGTYYRQQFLGSQLPGNKATLTLGKGNYFVFFDISMSAITDGLLNESNVYSFSDNDWGSYTGATCEIIDNKYDKVTATQKSNSYYAMMHNIRYILKCNVPNSATFVGENKTRNYPTSSMNILVEAIKID